MRSPVKVPSESKNVLSRRTCDGFSRMLFSKCVLEICPQLILAGDQWKMALRRQGCGIEQDSLFPSQVNANSSNVLMKVDRDTGDRWLGRLVRERRLLKDVKVADYLGCYD